LGDERRFKQVLINLIKNAYKFTSAQGKIDIKTSYDNKIGELTVHVQDTGVGIAPNDIQKLFSRFGKLHRTAKLNNEGIGLGLTIVKQIVEASEGTVGVYSEGKDKGSLFYFTMKMPPIKASDNGSQGLISDNNDSFVQFNNM
jgi:signal transduction histidine kinase